MNISLFQQNNTTDECEYSNKKNDRLKIIILQDPYPPRFVSMVSTIMHACLPLKLDWFWYSFSLFGKWVISYIVNAGQAGSINRRMAISISCLRAVTTGVLYYLGFHYYKMRYNLEMEPLVCLLITHDTSEEVFAVVILYYGLNNLKVIPSYQ